MKTAKKSHFEKHLGSKTHQNKVALEVVASASAVVDSGCPSKETVSQEENDLGAQPTSNNRMNTSRASAVKARTSKGARARAREEGSFACTQCQFTAASRWHFERHQKTHQKKVASEVVASAVIDSGCPSKKTVSQEENDLGAVSTLNRLKTSRASARRASLAARTRCASMLKE